MPPFHLRVGELDADLERRVNALRRGRFAALPHDREPNNGLRDAPDALAFLRRLAAGTGPPLQPHVARRALRLKIHSLASASPRGGGAVRDDVLERLLTIDEHGLIPVVPVRHPRPDAAPMAHAALALAGEGEIWDDASNGPRPAAEALADYGLAGLEISLSEARALAGGTQFLAAVAAESLSHARALLIQADVAAALSLRARGFNADAWSERPRVNRGHPGEAVVAANLRAMLEIVGGEGPGREPSDDRPDAPPGFAFVPAVHGAAREALKFANAVFEIELNATSEHAVRLPNGRLWDRGTAHAQPLAMALDLAAIAIAEVGNLCARRLEPMAEWCPEPGAARFTANALVSENKVLAHPASVEGASPDENAEDWGGLGSPAAMKLVNIHQNTEHLLALELLACRFGVERWGARAGRGARAVGGRLAREIPRDHPDPVARMLELMRAGVPRQAARGARIPLA